MADVTSLDGAVHVGAQNRAIVRGQRAGEKHGRTLAGVNFNNISRLKSERRNCEDNIEHFSHCIS